MGLGDGDFESFLQRLNSVPSSEPSAPYLDRLKGKQARLVNEIHLKHRELATVSALIQFLTDKPEIADVAEKAMEV